MPSIEITLKASASKKVQSMFALSGVKNPDLENAVQTVVASAMSDLARAQRQHLHIILAEYQASNREFLERVREAAEKSADLSTYDYPYFQLFADTLLRWSIASILVQVAVSRAKQVNQLWADICDNYGAMPAQNEPEAE